MYASLSSTSRYGQRTRQMGGDMYASLSSTSSRPLPGHFSCSLGSILPEQLDQVAVNEWCECVESLMYLGWLSPVWGTKPATLS